jgi:serine/threonine protein kinase
MDKSHQDVRSSVHSIPLTAKSQSRGNNRSSSVVSSSVSICEKIRIFDELKQVRSLSQNNFAVYLVFSEKTFEYLVMKVFPTKDGEPSGAFQRSQRVSNLWHENILQITDVKFKNKSRKGVPELKNYLVSELAPFGNFDTLLRKRVLQGDEVLARTYFHQLVNSLDYLHSNGMAHMNLNPAHLLIGDHYRLKLCGFSNLWADDLPKTQNQGTKGFKSPQVKNFAHESPYSSDMYAAGVILFVMYTGMLPYKEDLAHDDIDLWSLLRDNETLYWNAFHDLQDQIIIDDPGFKELFFMMTKYDHEKRANVYDIRENAWYRGPIYSDKKLIEVMKNKYHLHPMTHSPLKSRGV